MVHGVCTELEVLKYAGELGFTFSWTKKGPKPLKRTNNENALIFTTVGEEDLGYYQCEVKENKTVVLTIIRALYTVKSSKLLNVINQSYVIIFLCLIPRPCVYVYVPYRVWLLNTSFVTGPNLHLAKLVMIGIHFQLCHQAHIGEYFFTSKLRQFSAIDLLNSFNHQLFLFYSWPPTEGA